MHEKLGTRFRFSATCRGHSCQGARDLDVRALQQALRLLQQLPLHGAEGADFAREVEVRQPVLLGLGALERRHHADLALPEREPRAARRAGLSNQKTLNSTWKCTK